MKERKIQLCYACRFGFSLDLVGCPVCEEFERHLATIPCGVQEFRAFNIPLGVRADADLWNFTPHRIDRRRFDTTGKRQQKVSGFRNILARSARIALYRRQIETIGRIRFYAPQNS